MAIVVIDECSIGASPLPTGGAALHLKEIKGFPEGMELVVQLGPNALEEFLKMFKPKVETATPQQAQKEASLHATADRLAGPPS